ncbi:MAG TPA: DUF92 domain-containing protein [Thermomicrobiales bacterium]|nr:DUF92 domain-containing protein [Thermomicrobiales bacterium]
MPLPDFLSSDLARWLLAFVAAVVISGSAFRLRSLTADGAAAAVVLGTALVGLAGWWSGVLLVVFFVSASILSQRIRRRSSIAARRGHRRDVVQVTANGGFALLMAIVYAATGAPVWLLGVAGAIASANADTWSTEVGRLSQTPPRMVTTWREVPAGTSGAVSPVGLLGAAAGASLIAALAASGVTPGWFPASAQPITTIVAVIVGGIVGSVVDSILGATVQEQRWCPACNKQTEMHVHVCDTPTLPYGGKAWITNDVVNAACTISGGVLAILIGLIPG